MDNFKPINPNTDYGELWKEVQNMELSSISPMNFSPPIIETSEIEPLPIASYLEKSEEYQKQSLEMLKSINQNTANLYTLVDLISKSNDKQDEILNLISEILTIAKAKEKKEAESIFKKVMTKINDTAETADSMIKLIGWATIIFKMVVTMLPQ